MNSAFILSVNSKLRDMQWIDGVKYFLSSNETF